jgi:hypothetical protein
LRHPLGVIASLRSKPPTIFWIASQARNGGNLLEKTSTEIEGNRRKSTKARQALLQKKSAAVFADLNYCCNFVLEKNALRELVIIYARWIHTKQSDIIYARKLKDEVEL